jgi:hypothetical protein
VKVQTIVEAKRSVPIESMVALVTGTDKCSVGSGKNRQTYRKNFAKLSVQLCGSGELRRRRSSYRWQFTLPEDSPPSFEGRESSTRYAIEVQVAIPWWPDRRSDFAVQVVLPPATVGESPPEVFSTNPDGPTAQEPYLECSLATRTLAPGSELHGSVALSNVAHNRYRKLVLALVAREYRKRSDGRSAGSTLELHRFKYELPLDELVEGEAIPFHLRLPAAMPPSFQSHLWTLRWSFEARASIGWGKDAKMRVPLTVVPKGSRLPAPDRNAVASVGSARVQRIWKQVAQTLGADFDGWALRAKRARAQVIVRRDHRGGDGIFLVAEIRFASLQLCLDGGLASGFHRLMNAGLKIGHDDWDRRHYLTGREAAQIQCFMEALSPKLVDHTVSDMDDEHLVLEMRDAGQTAGPLATIAEAALQIAECLPSARLAIPPPAAMKTAVPSWRKLAAKLGGPLETARMAVSGRFDSAKVEVWTDWSADARAERTALRMHLGFPVDDRHSVEWSEGTWTQGDPQLFPGRTRSLLPKVLDGALGLSIRRKSIEVSLPAPLLSTKPILNSLHRLAQLAALLRGKTGPYR